MPTFEELKQRYMATSFDPDTGSGSSGGATNIPTYTGCLVTPHIHGRNYYPALKSKINAVSGDGAFIYLTGWWLDPTFSLDGPGGARIIDLLKAKARAGVDVRVLGWVMPPEIMQSRLLRAGLSSGGGSIAPVIGMLRLNEDTMNFILALRSEPALADKAALNILSHPAGAVHIKYALIGNNSQATGFTGGLDLHTSRWQPNWHDVQVEVSGPVCQGFFEAFQTMWNENQSRSPISLTAISVTCDTRTPGMPNLPARTVRSTSSARSHAQSLRTLSQFNFSATASVALPTNRPLSYARNGLFETKAAWRHALSGAQHYIYIEDQAFTSQEVFDWVNAAVRANDELRVVVVTGMPDPNDAPNSILPKFFGIAVNEHLLRGLNSAQITRVGVFRHRTATIHTKTTIIDDHWAIIGSTNAMRRSLYTDFEHSVAYMDEDNRAVQTYRADLWGVHLLVTETDADTALATWFSIPLAGSGAASPNPAIQLDRLNLPLTRVTLTSSEQALYDEIYDVDSRRNWGGSLLSLFMNAGGGGSLLSP